MAPPECVRAIVDRMLTADAFQAREMKMNNMVAWKALMYAWVD